MNLFTAAETTANYAAAGAGKAKLPISKMLLLGILAGALIAFPACVTNMAAYGLSNNSVIRVVCGLLFAFGLGMVVISGAELFTGNTLMTISVLEKKATLAGMLRNWLFVYAGNFIGSAAVSLLCAGFGWLDAGGNALAAYSMKVAVGKMTMPVENAFVMGVLCNILVTIGVLLSLSGKDGVSRFLGAWAPVMFFVTCGFNHSVADMTYCMLGLFARGDAAYTAAAEAAGVAVDSLTWGNYVLNNLIPVTLGNIVGGVCVAFIFWFCFLRRGEK